MEEPAPPANAELGATDGAVGERVAADVAIGPASGAGLDEPRVWRWLGAALGAAPGPVAAYAQGWAGTGDGGVHVCLLATLVGALLGALTLPVFRAPGAEVASPAAAVRRLGVGFAALFGFSVGLVAGAFAAFPMGAVMGAFGGALAGAVVAAVTIVTRRFGARLAGLVLAWAAGAGLAWLAAWAWFQ